MEKTINGRTYTIGKLEHDHSCDCTSKVAVNPDGGIGLDFEAGNECWESRTIEINGITIYHNAYGPDVEFANDADKEKLNLPESELIYGSISDVIRDILGDETYFEFVSDKTPRLDEHHAEIRIEALKEYITENNLTCYMDDMRGFSNEWCLTLATTEDKIPDDSKLYKISLEDALRYVGHSVNRDYDYDCTSIAMYDVKD